MLLNVSYLLPFNKSIQFETPESRLWVRFLLRLPRWLSALSLYVGNNPFIHLIFKIFQAYLYLLYFFHEISISL